LPVSLRWAPFSALSGRHAPARHWEPRSRSRRAALGHFGQAAKPVLGVFIVLVGALVLGGWDKSIEATVTAAMPDWLVLLTTRF